MTQRYEQHPLSRAFPPMPPEDFRELVEDVRRQGVLEPITLLDGMVLDGWHRYQAGLEAGVEVPTKLWRNADGVESAFAYVWAKNALRRQLTRAQRISIVQKTHPEEWERVGSGVGGRPRKNPTGTPEFSTSQLAELAGVEEHDVRRAKRLEEIAPDFWARTAAGERGFDLDAAYALGLQKQAAAKAKDQRESDARRDMEWKNAFVAELIRKIDAVKEIPKEIGQGRKFEKFSPEARPFLVRRLASAIRSLEEAQEELK